MINTSLELSKKLKENGCELESEYWYAPYAIKFDKDNNIIETAELKFLKVSKKIPKKHLKQMEFYYSYDLFYDICIKYAKEFFSSNFIYFNGNPSFVYMKHAFKILEMLQQNKPQKEIEDYIWENCLFNPANKKEEK